MKGGKKQHPKLRKKLTDLNGKIDGLKKTTSHCDYNKAKLWRYRQMRAHTKRRIQGKKSTLKPRTKRQHKLM